MGNATSLRSVSVYYGSYCQQQRGGRGAAHRAADQETAYCETFPLWPIQLLGKFER
jgi:hypothetical protein